jgi:hypothetical protein
MGAEALTRLQPLLASLSREEKLLLLDVLSRELAEPRADRIEVAGMWKGCVPEDVEIDEPLREIRQEWLKELDAMQSGEIP